MKTAFIAHHDYDGESLSKAEANELYNKVREILNLAKCEIKDDDVWLVTKERDAFGGNKRGCKNFKNGDWEYFSLEEFDSVANFGLDGFIKVTLGKALYSEDEEE